ncbi:MAG: hypothetical protein IRZ09_13055 [Variibacter sp.]|nr:hypothetical protein [Variibacter sp.]
MRRMMAVSLILTALAVAAVFGVIGYRVFTREGSRPVAEASLALPQGARVIATAIADDRILVTVETGEAVELWLFDRDTLRPRGRLRLGRER